MIDPAVLAAAGKVRSWLTAHTKLSRRRRQSPIKNKDILTDNQCGGRPRDDEPIPQFIIFRADGGAGVRQSTDH